MPVSPNVKQRLITSFTNELARARDLHNLLVLHGHTSVAGGDPTPLMQPDRRDATQFIYFEVAARFEHFALEAFRLEVRVRLDISPSRAAHVMGNADRGLGGVMGWASPQMLMGRARNLFGRNGFFGRLTTALDNNTYQRLGFAHRVRNRIAHNGQNARDQFNQILGQLQVPAGSRQGLSVGRLLLDYPAAVADNDRWFYRFLGAYEQFKDRFDAHVVL